MITQQLLEHGRGAVERWGLRTVALCCAVGCLFPVVVSGLCCLGLLLALAEWR